MDTKNELNQLKGKFGTSLRRNNKQIKDDRAIAIIEGTELIYKREVEDLEVELKELQRTRESMLDLGGTSKDMILSVADFKVKEFVSEDLKIGLQIHQTSIKLEIARNSYKELFTEAEEEKVEESK